MASFQSYIRTIDGDTLAIEEVPAATELGRLYGATLKAREKHAEVNTPLTKLKREQQDLEEKVRAASLDNTTPEDFALAQAKLELVNRKVRGLKEKESPLFQDIARADRALLELQSRHSSDVTKYLESGHTLRDVNLESLKRQIVARYTVAAAA